MIKALFAKLDKAFSLVRLFSRSTPESTAPLVLKQDFEGTTLQIESPCGYLGAREQGVLLYIIAWASVSGSRLAPLRSDGLPSVLMSQMFELGECSDTVPRGTVLVISCSKADLIRTADLTWGGENFIAAMKWLENLAEVRLSESGSPPARLIAFRQLEDGSIRIALHPRLSRAALPGGSHASIRLDERHELGGDSAGMLLHARLSAMHRPGCERPYLISTLAQAVWPGRSPEEFPSKWLRTMETALCALDAAGWKCKWYGGYAYITRPRLTWKRAASTPHTHLIRPSDRKP